MKKATKKREVKKAKVEKDYVWLLPGIDSAWDAVDVLEQIMKTAHAAATILWPCPENPYSHEESFFKCANLAISAATALALFKPHAMPLRKARTRKRSK